MIPSKNRNKATIISLKSLLSIAAGIALLVTINIYSIQKTTVSENQHEQLYTTYFDYLTELV
jgi:CHASE3 domain sensor protein